MTTEGYTVWRQPRSKSKQDSLKCKSPHPTRVSRLDGDESHGSYALKDSRRNLDHSKVSQSRSTFLSHPLDVSIIRQTVRQGMEAEGGDEETSSHTEKEWTCGDSDNTSESVRQVSFRSHPSPVRRLPQ